MDGGRRVRATSVLPRFGPPCLFKGHLSTKSNAAIDCSIPISLTNSIKYADQQRREKLKKELAQCQRDFKLSRTIGQAKSKINTRSIFSSFEKPSGEPQVENEKNGCQFVKEVSRSSSFPMPLLTSSESLSLNLRKTSETFTTGTEKHTSAPLSIMDYNIPKKTCSRIRNVRRPKNTFPSSHRFQLVISKASNGDLLDKHSDLFSNSQSPFTPRTLKSEAKSFLSQYRYYTPAKRKQNLPDEQTAAETQKESNSLKSDSNAAETENVIDSELTLQKVSSCLTYEEEADEEITRLPLEMGGLALDTMKDDTPRDPSSAICPYSLTSPLGRKGFTDKEELLYLSFIENITEDILKVGLFSNRFLEQLFERHIKQNKHHLEEDKMRQMLHVLKVDLGCISKENSVTINVGMSNLPDLNDDGSSKPGDAKNESDIELQLERKQYLKALDMLLSLPKDESEMLPSSDDFHLPPYKSKSLEGVIIQQLNDETTSDPAAWGEHSSVVSDSLAGQEACVNVVVVDSDAEEAELSGELCCVSTALPLPGGGSDDSAPLTEGPTLKITEISTENCPSVADHH